MPTKSEEATRTLLPDGKLWAGVNYWASHAGTAMWRNWNEGTVRTDLSDLKKARISNIRVFPLWPDFQPIHCLRGFSGELMEFRHGEVELPSDSVGLSGVSAQMLARFRTLCDLAGENGIGVVVALVTGWMSGRLFVPPALEGLNPITSDASMVWQVRMVRTLVSELKAHPAIKAWELGNECNCMGPADKDSAWVWSHAISSAVRSADGDRPILSGMHGLKVDPAEAWSIRDQGELTDALTTHPYAIFTAHCNREPLNTMRPVLHSVAETRLYSDLSKRPAFVEETSNLGPAFCHEGAGADILRTQLFSLWAHDCRSLMWWCAYDQTELDGAPYDWFSLECALGLFRPDRSPKPVAEAMVDFIDMTGAFPSPLPPCATDAVCVLTRGQDQWGAAFSAFLLAKQAGIDLRFHFGDESLPAASLYLLPSICGYRSLSRPRERELLEKVRSGATLYVSLDDGLLAGIMENTGLHVRHKFQRKDPCEFRLDGAEAPMSLMSSTQYEFAEAGADVLARDGRGAPVFTRHAVGRGWIYCLALPLETELAKRPGEFMPGSTDFSAIYRAFARREIARRHIRKSSEFVGVTEHPSVDGSMIAVLVNYAPEEVTTTLSFSDRFVYRESLHGPPPAAARGEFAFKLPVAGACVWKFGAS